MDWGQARTVLILKPSSLGDIVHTLPVLPYLMQAAPHLRISWLANTEWMPILQGHPHLAEILEFPRARLRGLRGVPGFLRYLWLTKKRTPPPDVVLDFQGLLRTGLIAWASRAKVRAGLSDAREGSRWFYHKVAPVGGRQHAVDRYRAFLRHVGIPTNSEPEFWLPEGEPPPLPLPERFVVLHPFSRGQGKSLSPAQVGKFCQTYPGHVVVLGRTEEAVAQTLALPNRASNLLNRTTLAQLIHCLRRAEYTVSVDSGPMHLAAALSSRVLSLHAWSEPALVGPYPPNTWVWKDGEFRHRGEPGGGEAGRKSLAELRMEDLARFVEDRMAKRA